MIELIEENLSDYIRIKNGDMAISKSIDIEKLIQDILLYKDSELLYQLCHGSNILDVCKDHLDILRNLPNELPIDKWDDTLYSLLSYMIIDISSIGYKYDDNRIFILNLCISNPLFWHRYAERVLKKRGIYDLTYLIHAFVNYSIYMAPKYDHIVRPVFDIIYSIVQDQRNKNAFNLSLLERLNATFNSYSIVDIPIGCRSHTDNEKATRRQRTLNMQQRRQNMLQIISEIIHTMKS